MRAGRIVSSVPPRPHETALATRTTLYRSGLRDSSADARGDGDPVYSLPTALPDDRGLAGASTEAVPRLGGAGYTGVPGCAGGAKEIHAACGGHFPEDPRDGRVTGIGRYRRARMIDRAGEARAIVAATSRAFCPACGVHATSRRWRRSGRSGISRRRSWRRRFPAR